MFPVMARSRNVFLELIQPHIMMKNRQKEGEKKKPQLLWKFHLYSSGRGGLDTVLADKKKYETKTVTTLASSDAVRPLLCKCIISKT